LHPQVGGSKSIPLVWESRQLSLTAGETQTVPASGLLNDLAGQEVSLRIQPRPGAEEEAAAAAAEGGAAPVKERGGCCCCGGGGKKRAAPAKDGPARPTSVL
jgi:hypothetical protein